MKPLFTVLLAIRSRETLVHHLSLLLLCAGSVSGFAQAPAPGQISPPGPSYSVVYTSRLFGYFRYPDVQEIHEKQPVTFGCDGETPLSDKREPEAVDFQKALRQLADQGHPADVLVSTGDNFAPFLLGRRALLFREKQDPELVPKEYCEYEKEGWVCRLPGDRNRAHLQGPPVNPGIPEDNVACFLRRMHFDAVVPGKHDFYFGPERLRELARLLADKRGSCSAEIGKGVCPVSMLAANLFIKTQLTESEKVPQKYAGPLYAALPKVVTPWMRRIVVAAADKAAVDRDVFKFPPRVFLRSKCHEEHTIVLTPAAAQRGRKDQLVYEIPRNAPLLNVDNWEVLSPDCTYEVEYQATQESSPTTIGQFTVAYPFLTNSDPPSSAAENQPKQQFHSNSPMWPWKEISLQNSEKLVIFGIVDRNLVKAVGKLNYTWLGTAEDPSKITTDYESVVQVSDPAEALAQVLEYCEQSGDCKKAHKLVLAQMSQSVALEEIGRMRKLIQDTTPLELVITDADPDRATGNRTTVFKKNADDTDQSRFQPTVLVPGAHFRTTTAEDISPYNLTVRLQSAKVSLTPNSRIVENVENTVLINKDSIIADPLANRPELVCSEERTSSGRCSNVKLRRLQDTLDDYIHKNKFPRENGDLVANIALHAMRAICHSDVALLQNRDIFHVDKDLLQRPVTPAGLEAAVSAMFWKGDFVQCLNITGDTLQNVLARSDELKTQEEAGLLTELTNGWWLHRAGIELFSSDGKLASSASNAPAPSHVWMVNGGFLDSKKLYTVAVTDYLANGDTGYPMLHGAEPEPNPPLPSLKIRDLTTAVASMLMGNQTPPALTAGEVLDSLNRSKQKPERATNTTFSGWLDSWTEGVDALSSQPGSFGRYAQTHPVFSLKLYKLDFGLSLFQHNGTEGDIPKRFPGVTSVDLSNTDSFMYTADYQIRAERAAHRFGPYFESDLNFGRNNKRGNVGAKVCFPPTQTCYQASQTANYWYQEGGLGIRLTPVHQNPTGLKAIMPIGFRTQVVRPYTQVTSLPPLPGPVSAPRNYYLAFRPGLRYEHTYPRGTVSALSPPASKTVGGAPTPGTNYNSYVEVGFQTGRVFNSPSAYHFSGLLNSAACPVTDGFVSVNDLADCLLSGVIVADTPLDRVNGGRNFYQQGFYLNFRLDMPVPGKSNAELVIENRGDYFLKRPTDLPIDTRFLANPSATLLVPLWQKISVGPAVGLTLFKTKGTIPGNYYFSYSTSLVVNYSFDWRRGLQPARALGYGTSDPAPLPLPSR